MRNNLRLVVNNPHNKIEEKQFFEKDELKIILDLYAKMVSEGSWKDYGLNISSKQVSFSVFRNCLLYTSPSPRDATLSRMPSSA